MKKEGKVIYENASAKSYVFYCFQMIQEDWLEMTLWDNLSNEEIFDKEAFIGFIEVLDNYKDYLLYEE